MDLINLLIIFFAIGLMAIGGGMAVVGIVLSFIDQFHFISKAEFVDMIAISQSTPGPLGVNTASFVGFKLYGLLGSFLTSLALVLPSLIIIILINYLFKKIKQVKLKYFINKLKILSLLLISIAIINLFVIIFITNNNLNYLYLVIYLIYLMLVFCLKKINPIFLIILAAMIGVVFKI